MIRFAFDSTADDVEIQIAIAIRVEENRSDVFVIFVVCKRTY